MKRRLNSSSICVFRGFTLIELLVTIAVLAVLVTVAAPSMERTIKKSSVNGHQRDFLSAVSFARGEASVLGAYVSMCPSENGINCDQVTNNWSNGWLVFRESGQPDGNYVAASEDLLRVYEYDGGNTVTVKDPLNAYARLNTLTWSHRGFAFEAQRSLITVCESGGDEDYARGIMISAGGRAIPTRDTDNDLVHELAFEQDDGTLIETEITCP